ncbi:MAG TPA: hypothetical protein VE244_07880 [Nitrososphaeraceae archaeon]|nr:hypothetical protein [Nitrososphaeraceae archaeon]
MKSINESDCHSMMILYSDGQQSMYCMLIAEEDDFQINTKKPNKTDKEHYK